MKRGKKLTILFGVLLAIVAVTLAVSLLKPKDTGNKADEKTTVFTLDAQEVTGLGWDYSDEISFTLVDGKWVCDSDAAFPVDKKYLQSMLDALKEVKASKTIQNAGDLDQYGLLYPVCAITVKTGDTTYNLAIGDQNSMNGQRYFSTGDGNVYMVDNKIAGYFSFKPEEVLAKDEIPKLADISALKVEANAQNYEIRYVPDNGKTYSDSYVWLMNDKVLDTELTESLLSVIKELEWKKCVDYNATDLAKYGLDTPAATITVTYAKDKTFVLELGNKTESYCYARVQGSNMVYEVNDKILESYLYATYDELKPDDVLKMDWATVTAMDITIGGETYPITGSPEADENGCATGKTIWKYKDKAVSISSIINNLDKMKATGYATALQPEQTEEIRIVFHRNTGSFDVVTLAFYRYNSNAYLVTLDGVATVLVERDSITTLTNAINQAVK